MDLSEFSVGELLALSRRILSELRRRGVIRTGNAPAGDYAELLVQRATNGELAPNSQKSWDVLTSSGERLQVKARVVTDPMNAGERQLSPFRSWDFDAAVIVLFADDFQVWRAVRLPAGLVRDASRFSKHVRGDLVIARNELLDQGEDWTERLHAVDHLRKLLTVAHRRAKVTCRNEKTTLPIQATRRAGHGTVL